MKKEIADRWICALRSGEYRQGKEQLANSEDEGNSKFCCLGVLCDIALNDPASEVGGIEWYKPELPSDVVEWSGIKTNEGRLPRKGIYPASTLWGLNDGAEYSFAQIADVIEAEWEAL